MRPGTRRALLALVALCASALAGPRHAAAQADAPPFTAHLPYASAPVPADACARSASCKGSAGWVTVCGGSGRVRDMFALADGRAGGDPLVVTLGDGVGTFEPLSWQWRSQIGSDLSGLNALYVEPEQPYGWSVGDRNRIARYDGSTGCWREHDPGRINGRVSLSSVMVGSNAPGGWSVGRFDDLGLISRLRYEDGLAVWDNMTPAETGVLPTLSDLHVADTSEVMNAAWLISGAGGSALPGVLGTDVTGEARVEISAPVPLFDGAGRPATPYEIAMVSQLEGWVAGEVPTEDGTDVTAWRLRGALDWVPDLVASARGFVDLYFDRDVGRWWIGLVPSGGPNPKPVLRYTTRADALGIWQDAGTGAPIMRPADASGSQAIAPLDEHRVLYAWGDDVWLFDGELDSWARVRQRRQLRGVAPSETGAGGWAIADVENGGRRGSRLLWFGLDGLHAERDAGGGEAVLPRLQAADSGGGVTWAVGEAGGNGVILRQRGTTGAWRTEGSVWGVRFVDVSATALGEAWAVGVTADGRGQLWRDDDAVGWLFFARTERPLHAVAALPNGRVWAVGTGTVCECVPGRTDYCTCDEDLRLQGRLLRLTSVAAVDTPDGPSVWAAGEHYILRRGPDGWRARDARAVGGVPIGAAITGLAAGAEDDLWVLATCNPYREAGRGVSIVNRLDGRFAPGARVVPSTTATALSVPINDLKLRQSGAGQRTVWLAGDWSTLVRRTYRPGEPFPSDGAARNDLWCVPDEVAGAGSTQSDLTATGK